MKWYKLYMPIVNVLKVGVIWFTDLINKLWYPFDLVQTYGQIDVTKLPPLETQFVADLDARFINPSGEFLYTLPRPTDAGDTALFHGLATGMKVLRGDDVSKQLDFIKTLFPNNRLIRGYRNDGTMNDTTSNDSASGILFFFYAVYKYGWPSLRVEAANILIPWLRQLKADNWALCDQQDNPTKYGVLDNGVMTDPLRVTILLALLALASGYSTPEFAADYDELYNKYKLILAYPKVKFLWYDTKYDTHRAAINLHVLYDITGDKRFKKGLERIWRISRKQNNAWVYTLCHPALDDTTDSFIVKSMLCTFDFARRQLGDVESINSTDSSIPSVYWPVKLPFKDLFESVLRSKYPLPLSKRGSQDFFWQRDMNSLDEWVGNTMADVYHSGLDFLICYNLAKKLGIV